MSETSKIAGPVFLLLILVSITGLAYFQFIYMPLVNKEIEVPEEWENPPEKTTIEIAIGSVEREQEDNFLPKEITVILGKNNAIIWTNLDGIIHTVTAEIGKEFIKSTGNSNFIDPEGEFEFIFLAAGEYTYYCAPHPWMRGTITVLEPEA